LGIVGEIGRNTASFSSEEFDFDVDGNVFAYGGGVKFAGRASPNATVFAQVVAGVARLSVSGLGESESTTEFMLQPGAGVDLYFSRNVGVRIGGDYRRILVDLQDGLDEFRFHAGIVIGRR
jgi:opacity protein-like surface antigen